LRLEFPRFVPEKHGKFLRSRQSGALKLCRARFGTENYPVARFFRGIALRSKNSAWLTSAETMEGW
jgi:hypothetical protein